MTPLHQSIISTLAYFDQFEYPLTIVECWRYGISERDATLADVEREISVLARTRRIERHQGFVVLPGRSMNVTTRKERSRFAERKYQKALRFSRVLRLFPFIRMIGICNTLALSHSRQDADIDFFIIVAPGHIWAARFWTTLFALFIGERPEHYHMRDSFCLSFYVTEDALDLRRVALDAEDIYLANWVAQLMPVYDAGGVYSAFWNANQWTRDLLPHAFARVPARRRLLERNVGVRVIQGIGEILHNIIGPDLERLFRRVQKRRLPDRLRRLARLANIDSRVVVSDTMLKFHEGDRRALYRSEWEKRVQGLSMDRLL